MKSPLKKSIGEVVTDYGARVMKVFKKGLLQRSLFDFYGDVKADKLRVKESSSVPATPVDKDGGVIYIKSSDGKLYYKSNEVAEVELSASDTVLTSEQVQDIVGAMFTSNTETRISATYEDSDGTIDLVVDAIPVDLTSDGAGTIHANNVPTLNQSTTGNAATATLATNAQGITGATDGDVTITSDGEVTVKLDSDNDESLQKFKVTDNSDAVVFSVDEGGAIFTSGSTISNNGSDNDLEIQSDGSMTFTIDRDDDEVGQSFSFKNFTTEIANLSERGDMQLDGVITAKIKQMFNMSFHDDLSTTKHWMPWSGTLEQSANAYQEEVAMAMPYGGKIVSCLVRAQAINSSGNLTIGIETKEPGALVGSSWTSEETETLAVGSTDANHAFHFVFSNAAHFDPGDLVAMSIQSSSDLSNSTYWYITTVVEFDLNDPLGTSSAEYDTGQ